MTYQVTGMLEYTTVLLGETRYFIIENSPKLVLETFNVKYGQNFHSQKKKTNCFAYKNFETSKKTFSTFKSVLRQCFKG